MTEHGGFTCSYLYTDEHAVLPVYHCCILLLMRSVALYQLYITCCNKLNNFDCAKKKVVRNILEIHTKFKHSNLNKINPTLQKKKGKKNGPTCLFCKRTLSIPGNVLQNVPPSLIHADRKVSGQLSPPGQTSTI